MSASRPIGWGSALFDQHVDLLVSSGVSVDVARERKYVSADTKASMKARGFGAAQCNVPALVIPLHDAWGELAGYQSRPDHPRIKDGKPLKYETPIGSRMVLDVPPRVQPHLGDPSRPLFVTEGARKADAAVAAGLDCVALLGVWNWRGTNADGGKVALPDWEAVALNGRPVYVVFDSDVMVKPAVHGALGRLKAFLEARGADVNVVYLPSGVAGAKVGLDDFLAGGHGVDDMLALASPELRPLPTGETETEPADSFDDVPPETGAQLLDDLANFLSRYVVFAMAEHVHAVALWITHTHTVDAAESTPRLVLQSPSKQSGKTRLLELAELLVRSPLMTANISAAALFRSVENDRPTLLLDECDAIFGPKAGEHEDLRGLLNAGHRRGATVLRCVGDGASMDVRSFAVFCAVALAGIGTLPDTIVDRAVVIPMRRRAPDEHVDEFRRRKVEPEATALRRRLAAWAARNMDTLAETVPAMPPGLTDRPADVWEPLVAVADHCGGTWPDRARTAAVTVNDARAGGETNLAVRLLAELRTIFDDDKSEWIATARLLTRLNDPDDAPWGKWNDGKGLDARDLAKHLKPYGVHPKKVRDGNATIRAYERSALEDAWSRYLSPSDPPEAGTSGTPGTSLVTGAEKRSANTEECSTVPPVPHVPAAQGVDREGARAPHPAERVRVKL